MIPEQDSKPQVIFYKPEQMYMMFRVHEKRKQKGLSASFSFVVENEWSRKDSALQSEVESIAKRLYNSSGISAFYINFPNANINNNIKNLFKSDKLAAYNRGLIYLEENELPAHYSHYLADFLVATEDKFLHLDGEGLFCTIAVRFLTNSCSVLSGVGSPKLGKTIYNTLPKAFSQLFFQKVQFAGSILKDKKIRKNFEESLVYGFVDQMKNTDQRILKCNTREELDSIVEQALGDIQNIWWIPEKILTKFKQTSLYIKNSMQHYPPILDYLIMDYLWYMSNCGMNQEDIGVNPSCALDDIKNFLDLKLLNSIYDKDGYSIFDSYLTPGSCIYHEIEKLVRRLSNPNRGIKVLRLKKASHVGEAKLFSGTHLNIFNIA